MKTVTMHEAKTHLSRLVAEAVAGEEIIIAKGTKPLARLIPFEPVIQDRIQGTAKGKFWVCENFDDPLPEDLLELFEK